MEERGHELVLKAAVAYRWREEDMNRVSIGRHCCAQSTHLESFNGLVAEEILAEVRALARDLKGVRICNINSTAAGGGVAELLSRELPLIRTLEVAECAARVQDLLADPQRRDAYGQAGQEHVRAHFLLPRLVRDKLALVKSLL